MNPAISNMSLYETLPQQHSFQQRAFLLYETFSQFLQFHMHLSSLIKRFCTQTSYIIYVPVELQVRLPEQ